LNDKKVATMANHKITISMKAISGDFNPKKRGDHKLFSTS